MEEQRKCFLMISSELEDAILLVTRCYKGAQIDFQPQVMLDKRARAVDWMGWEGIDRH